MNSQPKHTAVMLEEAVASLNIQPNKWYVDATFGRGGHTRAMIEAGACVLALDFDQEAIEYGQSAFATEVEAQTLFLVRENFSSLEKVVSEWQSQDTSRVVRGILFDFGTSVDQLTNQERGFSFFGDGELDMRMDTRLGVQAKDLLAIIPEKQLAELFSEYGGEEYAKQIARAITAERRRRPITTTKQLVKIIEKVKKGARSHIHPATKVFQALRIAVNTELDNIAQALPQAFSVLEEGSIVTISFHEGEDRIVKQFFKEAEKNKYGENKPLIVPSESEIQNNPKARSAKLRVFTKKKVAS